MSESEGAQPRPIYRVHNARPHHRTPWSAEEDQELTRRILQGDLIGPIANDFGRTRESIRNRANLLGLEVKSSPGRGRRKLV